MKPPLGTPMECGLWYNADKPTERANAKKGVETAFFNTGMAYNVNFGPISYEDVDPLSPRVCAPPDHFQGTVRCLIGTARVVSYYTPQCSRFTDDLRPHELAEFRRATRDAFMRAGGFKLSDEECDDWINEVGPDAAVDTFH